MCPHCVSVQTSVSQALGVWERLEASRDLWGDAGKTFGKCCRGDALLVAAAFRPTPAMGAAGNYFNRILGEYCAENLIPNPKTLIPCGSAERWMGIVPGGNLTLSRGVCILFPWEFGGFGFVFFYFVPSEIFFPTLFIIISVN